MTQRQRHLNHQGLLQVSGSFQSNVAQIADITNPEESESSDSEAGASKPSLVSAGEFGGFVQCFMSQSTIFQSCWDVFLSFWVESVLSRGWSVLLKDTTQCLQ